mgnify:CR=1 FL=1
MLTSLINKFEQAKKNVKASVIEAFNSNSEEWAELNRSQLEKGYTKKGERIGEYQNPLYADVKNRMNPKAGYGNWDFKYTGAFYDSIYANAKGNNIITTASDFKLPILEKKTGKDALGLNEENKKKFIFNKFALDVKNNLGL